MINIQSDSRKIKKGDIFVALKCEVNDGHKYIEKAIENGASKIVAEHGNYSVPTLIVEDTRKYITNYLKENYNKYIEEMTIIGITGTNGKTTSAYLTYQALNKLGTKCAYIGTIGFYLDKKISSLPNTSVDICDTYNLIMEAYMKGYKTVVLEVSSHALANNRLETLRFDYGVFTNLTQDHLDFHKTMENYALAKQKLFTMLKPQGKAIINIDDEYKQYFLNEKNNNITYGFNKSDYQIKNFKFEASSTQFTYIHDNKNIDIKTKLIGKFNVYNCMIPIIILDDLGYKNKEVMEELKAPEGRMDNINYKGNNILIDYAHTPDAILKVINTVKEISKGNIYVVFGCTGDRDRLKRPIMTKIVSELSKYFIITNDDPHYEDPNQIVDDMLKEKDFNNFEVCLDRKEAIRKGIELLKKDDILLILGKGHEEVMIIKDERIPFNDRKVVEEIIKEQ